MSMQQAEAESDGYLISKRHSHGVFILLFLLYLFDYIDRQVVVSLFPFLKAEWGLSDTQCGMLISAVYWSILIFSFPVSILIDRWSRKNSIAIMSLLWGMATAACAFTQNFTQLFLVRSTIGIGEAGYAPGGTAMISGLFPERKRAQIMGLWNAAIPLGSALGIVIGGVIADIWGWRHAFGIVAIPGCIIALLFFKVKDYKTVDLMVNDKEAQGDNHADSSDSDGMKTGRRMRLGEILREFLHTPSLIFTYLGFAGNMFVTASLLSWLPSYYHRMDQIPMRSASLKAAGIMAMAIFGAPLGGWLADRWYQRRLDARLLFGGLTTLATAATLFIAMVFCTGATQYAVLFLTGLCAAAFVPATAAVTQDVVHPGLRAISYSLNVIVMSLLGSSLGPIFVGAISDAYGLHTAISLLPAFTAFAGVMFLIGSRFYTRDFEKVAKIRLETE